MPNGLGFALAYNGGTTIVMVQVVRTNRDLVCEIQNIFEPVMLKLKQYFTQVNHIDYTSNSDFNVFEISEKDDIIDFIKHFKFVIGVQVYSKVGHRSIFDVNVGDTSVTSDEFVGTEILFNLTGEKQAIVPWERELDMSLHYDNDNSTALDYLLH